MKEKKAYSKPTIDTITIDNETSMVGMSYETGIDYQKEDHEYKETGDSPFDNEINSFNDNPFGG